ncbi:GntR family transcriptional regulator [Streptomyces sp. NPDC051214]|uniref:GntR family transcriptional regulator n=1 Tax=Streptomyces sp. NPDC051214 TaxID=3155282 RepID=UPI00343A721A
MGSNRYEFIAGELRQQIATGGFSAGDQLPAESELTKLFGASRPTIRDALSMLENEGLIMRLHGRGNFVRHTSGQITYAADSLSGDRRAAVNAAIEVSVSIRETAAGKELASLLRTPPATALIEYAFLSHHMTFPYALARVYVPCDVARLDIPRASGSPLGDEVLDRLEGAGIHVANRASRVTARLPDAEEAWTLRIGTGTPVLGIERVSTNVAGRVVEASLLTLPGHSAEAVFTAHATTPAPDLEGAR